MKARACPICKRSLTAEEYAPFCSKRCADVDLQHWFTGAYSVPTAEPEEAPEDDEGQAGRPWTDPL